MLILWNLHHHHNGNSYISLDIPLPIYNDKGHPPNRYRSTQMELEIRFVEGGICHSLPLLCYTCVFNPRNAVALISGLIDKLTTPKNYTTHEYCGPRPLSLCLAPMELFWMLYVVNTFVYQTALCWAFRTQLKSLVIYVYRRLRPQQCIIT